MGWLTDHFRKPGQDDHGQPLAPYRKQAVAARQIDELIGIVKGVTADGMVHQGEVEYILQWLEANRGAMQEWPAKAIYPRLSAALADGRIDEEEEREILDLLLSTVGGNTAPQAGQPSDSTALPLCNPAPSIVFEGRTFCFTGKFSSGSRSWCQEAVVARGGAPADTITKKLHFLVIGEIGSRDWLHSTHGTKILKAVEYRDNGVPISIVSERHWFDHLR
jgi:NAD-dependent DNA ligase